MDIDRLARRASEQLATQPSRRGIVTRVAQLAGGAGALVAGLRSFGEAGAEDIKIGRSCCTGVGPCPKKKGERRRCPKNSEVGWTWFCTKPNGSRYLCKDCYDKSGEDVCVYARKQ